MTREQQLQYREELENELKGNILPFWMDQVPDLLNGGFHGHITHNNQVREKASKGAIQNARILWTFSAAYRMYRTVSYLEMADRAYRYILDHFLDQELGGVYWELDYQGKVFSSRKQIYALAFTIYALTEYHLACGKKKAFQTAIALFHDIEIHAFDKERMGYTEALSREWETIEDLRLSEKDPNVSKTMNTHLHILEAYANLYRIWKDPSLALALEKLIHLFLEKFINRDSAHLNLFFDNHWNLKSSLISYGHDIECAWLLHESARVLGIAELEKQTAELGLRMATKNQEGLDEDGGLFYEFFPEELKLDSDKHWWPQAEAMVGYYHAYEVSGEKDFARKSLNTWKFIQKFLVDRVHGEWHWSVDRAGIPRTEKEKAGFWKCPYHNGRACMELIRRIDTNLNLNYRD